LQTSKRLTTQLTSKEQGLMSLGFETEQYSTNRHIEENLMHLLQLRREILRDVDEWMGTLMGKLPPEVYQKVTIETLARLRTKDPVLAEWVHKNLS
jgi:hypothetical protein